MGYLIKQIMAQRQINQMDQRQLTTTIISLVNDTRLGQFIHNFWGSKKARMNTTNLDLIHWNYIVSGYYISTGQKVRPKLEANLQLLISTISSAILQIRQREGPRRSEAPKAIPPLHSNTEESWGRQWQCRRVPDVLASVRQMVVSLLLVRVVLFALVPLGDGVVRGQERRQVGGRCERAAGGSPGPVGQDAAALVEGVLWLGQLLGRRHRRRCLGEARERLGLAGVEAGEARPDQTK